MNAPAIKTENKPVSAADNQKDIENHKKIASHLDAASKSHIEAAKHHEAGNHEKAAQSTVVAHGHTSIAHEHQKEDMKHHATSK
jgi:hypothetical protein